MNTSKYRGGGIYVIRTRKPHAVLGLPIIGRHTGYVGRTNSYVHRWAQHLRGGGTYRAVAKDWADLDPRCYAIIPLPDWTWLQHAIETLIIWTLCPVYNERQQPPWNPRRIRPKAAAAQRFARDHMGRRVAAGVALSIRYATYAALLAVGIGAWAVTR